MFARATQTRLNERAAQVRWTQAPPADLVESQFEHGGPSGRGAFLVNRRQRLTSAPPETPPGAAATDVLRLIGELAGRFAILEPEDIGAAISDSLQEIARAWELDFVMLPWRASADASAPSTHCWTKHRLPPAVEPPPLSFVPFAAAKLDAGEPAWFTSINDVPEPSDRDEFSRHGVRSAAFVPVARIGAASGALVVGTTMMEHAWSSATIEQLRLVSGVFGQALARRVRHDIARMSVHGNGHTSDRSSDRPGREAPLSYAQRPSLEPGTGGVVGSSAAIRRALEQAAQVAATDSTVLLLGETGTGKELIATHIHELSARHGRAMVRVNCSAIPTTLIESELFGREKGAFTGALARQSGRFELADRSTIFLDEIGDLPADVQVKLLRVLEERQIERLGSPKSIRVDVRVIAATHRDLEKRINEEAFREDLFYRLNVFPIRVPPLRDRTEDIPLLVWRFVDEFSKTLGKRIDAIPGENMAGLQRYTWPGNIRELRNVVERAMIVTTGRVLTIALPAPASPPRERSLRLADVEKEHVRSVLEAAGWRIRGRNGAADRLGLRPTTLETRMAKLGLVRPKRM